MDYRSHLLVALILALTAWTYRGAWSAGFAYEDHNDHDAISAPWQGVGLEVEQARRNTIAFGIPGVRFLSKVTYRLNAAWSTEPRGYHVVNVAIHLVNGLLVYALAAPVVGAAAPVVAGLFLLGRIQVEAVAAVVNRSELLGAFWVLASLVLATRLDAGWRSAVLVTVCGCAAFWSKETTAAGLIFGLPAWVSLATPDRGSRRWLIPVLIWCALLTAAATQLAASPELHTFDRWAYLTYLGQQGVAVGILWARAVLPWLQSTVDLGVSHLSNGEAWVAVLSSTTLALFGVVLLSLWRSIAFGWSLWAATWTWATLWLRVVAPQPEHLHEHAFYLPMAGVSLAIVAIAVGVSPSRVCMASADPDGDDSCALQEMRTGYGEA